MTFISASVRAPALLDAGLSTRLKGAHAVSTESPQPAAPRRIPAARAVAAVDVGLVLAALLIALVGRNFGRMPQGLEDFLALRITVKNIVLTTCFAAGIIMVFQAFGLYDADRLRQWSREQRRVLLATIVMAAIAVVFLVTSRTGAFDRSALVQFWVFSFAAVVLARAVRARLTRHVARCCRALIVGTGPHALRICRELAADPLTRYRILGFVDTNVRPRSPFIARRTLGSMDQLEQILIREHIDEVYIGLPVKSRYAQIHETIGVCERVGVKALYRADIFDTEIARPHVQTMGSSAPLVELQVAPVGASLVVKRILDVLGATIALILLSPVMLGIAIAIKLTSAGPVIYSQERYGLNRSRFRVFKFRTMVADSDRLQSSLEARNEAQGPVFKIAHDPRITPVGRLLRRTSLDELPQLVNVLFGDMSLVGPRPLPLRDVSRITRPTDMRRFSMLPGLTGLWQVSGRSTLNFDDWIRLDLHYIDHWSFALELMILARTIPAVLRGTGAT